MSLLAKLYILMIRSIDFLINTNEADNKTL